MPCDSYVNLERRERERKLADREDSLKNLDALLASGEASITVDALGNPKITGWTAGEVDMGDLCALADIALHGSMAARWRIEEAGLSQASLVAAHGHS